MGNDVYGEPKPNGKSKLSSWITILLTKLLQPFVSKIIAKSRNIEKAVYLKKKVSIIPNGVDFQKFKPLDTKLCRNKTNLPLDKKVVLFLGEPHNPRKNIALLEKSLKILNNRELILVNPYPVSHDKVVYYLNAADVMALMSFQEGSPNVIKEAMACNCPIVSTDVGDVKEVIGNTKGCCITSFDPVDAAEKLKMALSFGKRTNGRENIGHLEASVISEKLIKVYRDAKESNQKSRQKSKI
jgi:glycosyltransferase involved in cell wall biosynthesis